MNVPKQYMHLNTKASLFCPTLHHQPHAHQKKKRKKEKKKAKNPRKLISSRNFNLFPHYKFDNLREISLLFCGQNKNKGKQEGPNDQKLHR